MPVGECGTKNQNISVNRHQYNVNETPESGVRLAVLMLEVRIHTSISRHDHSMTKRGRGSSDHVVMSEDGPLIDQLLEGHNGHEPELQPVRPSKRGRKTKHHQPHSSEGLDGASVNPTAVQPPVLGESMPPWHALASWCCLYEISN